MSSSARLVIVGSGQAAFQLVSSARSNGFDGSIRMVGEEALLPYQRPPLSKAFLRGEVTADGLPFAAVDFFKESAVEVIEDRAVALDPNTRSVTLAAGGALNYDRLVLATGSRCRQLPDGAGLTGVMSLRTVADAIELRERLLDEGAVTIVGGGFLGLEVASICAELGVAVRVVEVMPRLMSRNASEIVSNVFHRKLAARGVQFDVGLSKITVRSEAGRVAGLDTDRGYIPTNLVLACIGVVPNDELALEAGLPTSNGIVVNQFLRSGDQKISAIGDCAAHPNAYFGKTVRLESVQNAVDQAICVAGDMVGAGRIYDSLPWFWSEQAGLKLQIAGCTFDNGSSTFVHGAPDAEAFSVFHFVNEALVGAESVSRPKEHMLARKLLRSRQRVTPDDVRQLLEPLAQA